MGDSMEEIELLECKRTLPFNDKLYRVEAEFAALSDLKILILNEKTLLRYTSEITDPAQYTEVLGKGIRAGNNQFTKLHRRVAQISAILGMDAPEVFVRPDWGFRIEGKGVEHPRIEISSRCLNEMAAREMIHLITTQLVGLALGYTEVHHLVLRMQEVINLAMNLPGIGSLSITGGPQLYSKSLQGRHAKWSREAIFAADRVACALTANVGASVSGILMEAFQSRKIVESLDIGSFCSQMDLIETIESASAIDTKLDEPDAYSPYRVANVLQYAPSDEGVELRKIINEAKGAA